MKDTHTYEKLIVFYIIFFNIVISGIDIMLYQEMHCYVDLLKSYSIRAETMRFRRAGPAFMNVTAIVLYESNIASCAISIDCEMTSRIGNKSY